MFDPMLHLLSAVFFVLSVLFFVLAVRALRRSEQEYRDLFRSSKAAILLFDSASGAILECNPSAATLYGIDKDDLSGWSLPDLFVDTTQAPDLVSITESGESRKLESKHRAKGDRTILIEMLLSPVTFQTRRAVLSVNRELEPTRGEGPEARNMLSMLKATFDATADGILVLGPDGQFVTSNRLFVEMWRIPPDLLRPNLHTNLHRRVPSRAPHSP